MNEKVKRLESDQNNLIELKIILLVFIIHISEKKKKKKKNYYKMHIKNIYICSYTIKKIYIFLLHKKENINICYFNKKEKRDEIYFYFNDSKY